MKKRIGGQAVMEGVMMKNQDQYAVSVRRPDGKIETKTEEYVSVSERHKILGFPLLRGVVNFVESMVIGMKTLNYSAEFFEDEEMETTSKFDQWLERTFSGKGEKFLMGLIVVISLCISVGLFMILPYLISSFFEKMISSHSVILLIEGIVRVGLFLGYVVLISRMEDIKRLFMYHGAEHKTINCLEAGEELTPENVKKYSRLHKRCGTSFLFFVMIISIIIYFFIAVDTMWLRVLSRILLIPVIAGISYEVIRFAGNSDSKLVQVLSKPGLSLQYLTTKEPDEAMIEVAIASVEGVLDWHAYIDEVKKEHEST
ncbi:MAG: DUF1385 domain-containing protein [Anaerostipes sp.]|nr:DUF1385 domain-containing protein [Anaerostipes sp.]